MMTREAVLQLCIEYKENEYEHEIGVKGNV